ncbi:MAG: hypothetical protein FWC64_09750 [Treponema sp.]|nr:hypothetical protein [Treponema sp.]
MHEFFTEKQQENIKYFSDNLKDFLKNPLYKFKFAVIYDKEIVGIFDTSEAAIEEAAAKWPVGDFIIQQMISDDDVVSFLSPALLCHNANQETISP